jgi:riboflavin synthase
MYTGIVEATGRITDVTADPDDACDRRLTVESPGVAAGLDPGDSVSVSGACLTPETVTDGAFTAGLSAETVERTWFDAASAGDAVNVETNVLAKYVERLTAGA